MLFIFKRKGSMCMKITQLGILSHGQFMSALGDTVFDIAISYWILEMTGSTTIMATAASASLVARIIVSFFSGTIVDGVNCKKIVVGSDLIRGFLVLYLFITAYIATANVFEYIVVMVLIGAVDSFFKPAINSSIIDLKEDYTVERANAKVHNAGFLASILGNGIFSLIFGKISIICFFAIESVTYFYSAITEMFLKIPSKNNCKKESYIHRLKSGYQYVIKNSGFKAFVTFCSLLNLFLSMTNILLLPLVKENFSVKVYSVSMMFFTAGTILAMFLTEKGVIKMHDKKTSLITSCLLYTLFMIVMLFLNDKIILCIVFFICGFLQAIRQVIIISALQLNINMKYRGITFSFYSLILNLSKPISYIIGGFMSDCIGVKMVLAIAFSMSIIVVIMFSLLNTTFIDFIRKENSEEMQVTGSV